MVNKSKTLLMRKQCASNKRKLMSAYLLEFFEKGSRNLDKEEQNFLLINKSFPTQSIFNLLSRLVMELRK